MRIDLVTIFPAYFAALDLSLLGRAQEEGLLDVGVHDLRAWTDDRHRTVDDAPYGGGAGMVMRADVWGRALDEVLDTELHETAGRADGGDGVGSAGRRPRRVLAIPTPSGPPLTQRIAEDLAGADQIVVACGRYEGIDQRVADHYRDREQEVLEFSIGDYVLNGGEVAALVLVEAVGRLLDGVVGNPASLVEESYSEEGLLEYPAYTRPRSWRGREVPEVLLGGDHAAISRWRRDRALVRTAHRRPDLVERLDPERLDIHDREVLAGAGKVLVPGRADVVLRHARRDEAGAVAALARATFPLACPDFLTEEDIRAFVDAHLSESEFARMLDDAGDHRIIVAQVRGDGDPLIGYTLTVLGGPDGMPTEMVRRGRVELGAAYLSKCYVSPEWHGSGVSGALLERAVADVAAQGRNSQVALGTNIANKRARNFYRRHGFSLAGRRTFMVGEVSNIDDVLVRNLTPGRE
ncbi:tRNA (guanosine(37)-N1)-methyltransferase TrmD [Actinomyces polynesiensis]|uniref:tRNA (guanosine(37)-N1)-methyltransferase TrmD n=1 Tax=Actinomyces polynesiensis TaxID=1325934 RepID=UPI0005BA26AE|nr:tRNA (guanosine(37)-N1)-methyltransferase TrmD [Actinomyces polynesiensis]